MLSTFFCSDHKTGRDCRRSSTPEALSRRAMPGIDSPCCRVSASTMTASAGGRNSAGTDRNGPTAMLKSVAKLPLGLAVGTPVLNIRLQKELFKDCRPQVRALIESYFAMGGMQLQATVADQETLRKAYENPDAYPELMVRIGGYSTYYRELDRRHQYSILRRTEHEAQ